MFKPSQKIKKILGTWRNCAYIHRDGIVILENRDIEVEKGIYSKIEIWHIIPCEICIRGYDYTENTTKRINCLVCHNPSIIANGLEEAYISFGSGSDKTKRDGIKVNRIEFKNGAHTWTETILVDLLYSSVTIQPDHTQQFQTGEGNSSILDYYNDYSTYNKSIVVHGELPTRKEESLLLTVSA